MNAIASRPFAARWLLYLSLVAVAPVVLYSCARGVLRLVGGVLKQRNPVPGRMVPVGKHALQLYCTGTGAPAVVIEPGMGVDWVDWWPVFVPLSKLTEVCLYDRAGYGWSEPGPEPRTALRIATELHTLLSNAGIAEPYVLVAHSFGAYAARVYADRYGKSLMGMVLVDPSNEDEPPVPLFPLNRVLAVLPPLSVSQIPLLFRSGKTFPPDLASLPPAFRRRFAIGSPMDQMEAQRSEAAALPESKEQARAARIPTDLPLVVITAMHRLSPRHPDARVPDAPPAVHRELNERLARQSERGKQILAQDSGHMVPLDQPELIVDSVRYTMQQARLGDGTSRLAN